MEEKKILLITVLLMAILSFSWACVQQPATPTPTPTKTPAPTTPAGTPTPVPVVTIKCELCHTNPNNITQHRAGGPFCTKCHGIDVHSIHAATKGVTCDSCHGTPIVIPKAAPNHTVCENCHAPPPNSLKPSSNLLDIHGSRNVGCTACHGEDIAGIHKTAAR